MLDERFVWLALGLNVVGGMSYLVATLQGKTKPNRVSWFLWALAPLIAFGAELEKGVGLVAWMTFIVGFNPLMIFLASFVNKQAVWQLARTDYVYGGLSVLGLGLWWLTGEGNLAIGFSVLSDGLAAVPTVIKSWLEPESENYWVFGAGAVSAGITLLTIDTWDFAHYGFPAYILVVCVVLFSLIRFKPGRRWGKQAEVRLTV
jgi:hypothetical protein